MIFDYSEITWVGLTLGLVQSDGHTTEYYTVSEEPGLNGFCEERRLEGGDMEGSEPCKAGIKSVIENQCI